MHAQITLIQAPAGKITELRRIVYTDYLPLIRLQAGFRAAFMLTQEDDPDTVHLIQLWIHRAAMDHFRCTGELQRSEQRIMAQMPGIRIKRQDYVVQWVTEDSLEATRFPVTRPSNHPSPKTGTCGL